MVKSINKQVTYCVVTVSHLLVYCVVTPVLYVVTLVVNCFHCDLIKLFESLILMQQIIFRERPFSQEPSTASRILMPLIIR